jgi:excisionase family DNA binding protein
LVPASVRTEFVEAVADQAAGTLDESLWGSGPSAEELRLAALQGLKDDFVARRDLLTVSLSRSEVAELLGVSPQAVLDRLRDGDLVGLKDGREWRIPMWQVNASAERGFVPGIAELRRLFLGGVVPLSRWATTPNVDLGGVAPADALAAGRVPEVIAIAATATAAAW